MTNELSSQGETPTVSISWVMDETYLQTCWRDNVKHRTSFRQWTVPFGIVCLIAGLAMTAGRFGVDAVVPLPWLVLSIGVFEICWHFLDKQRWFKLMRKAPQANGRVSLTVSETGIDHQGPTASGRIDWSGITDVVAGDDGLFLVQGRGLSLYLPYVAFSGPDEVAAVESMYRQSAAPSENEKSQWG